LVKMVWLRVEHPVKLSGTREMGKISFMKGRFDCLSRASRLCIKLLICNLFETDTV
jgi:hypothetical protein